jgi:hypothetical protein
MIILEPFSEVPASEKWLFDNKSALDNLKKGLSQAKSGNLRSKDSFAKYADDDVE